MGTRYLPTAELELDGCVGELVGELGRGVATISSVLNITRLYSASGAVAGLGHGLQLATSFAHSRQVMQGKRLSDLPLHTNSLLSISVLYRALLQLFFHNTLLMGKSESGEASKDEGLSLRFLTPALKAFAATRASEGYLLLIESLGGQGYMEENGLGEALRDQTVERIWEGTASILSMDVIRVLAQSGGAALVNFIRDNVAVLNGLPSWVQSAASDTIKQLKQTLVETGECMKNVDMQRLGTESDFRIGKPLLDTVMASLAGVLLLQQAAWRQDKANSDVCAHARINGDQQTGLEDVETARLWVEGGHGDLERTLSTLRRLSRPTQVNNLGSSKLGHGIVYNAVAPPRSLL